MVQANVLCCGYLILSHNSNAGSSKQNITQTSQGRPFCLRSVHFCLCILILSYHSGSRILSITIDECHAHRKFSFPSRKT